MSKSEQILGEVATKLRGYRIPDGVPKDEGNLFRELELHWQNERQLGFVHPMPTDQQLTDFYAEEYRLVMNKTTGIDHYLSSPNYTAQVQSQANSVLRYLDTRIGRWLDIGAGYGLLLREAKSRLCDWDFSAFEADNSTHEDLKKIAKFHSDFQSFWNEKLDPIGSFNVVTISHVLEHLRDPEHALRRIRQHMVQSGLLMVEVPHDPKDWLCDPRRRSDLPHLWFFSEPGLSELVESSGFEILESSIVGLRRFDKQVSWIRRMKRAIEIRLRGRMALVQDNDWYAEGEDRCDLRVLARRK